MLMMSILSNFAAKLKNLDKGKKNEKEFFLNNLGLFFSARGKVLKNFKSRLFSIKVLDDIPAPESTPELATEPTKQKKYKSKISARVYE